MKSQKKKKKKTNFNKVGTYSTMYSTFDLIKLSNIKEEESFSVKIYF